MNRRDFLKASAALAATPLLSAFSWGDPAIGKGWADWYAAELVDNLDNIAPIRKLLLRALGRQYKAGGFSAIGDVRIETSYQPARVAWVVVATAAFR